MNFTPDGQHAIVVAEFRQWLDFRHPHTMKLESWERVQCHGLDHMESRSMGAT
jgi:hypothetical protein